MKKLKSLEFNDESIQQLFGFEDAESEPIERLKEYYFKKDTFQRITANLPVRILVGHKGTGKSALFKMAISEDRGNGNLPILIKPDDIADLGKDDENFLLRIRQWKLGLIKIIGAKVFSELGLYDDDLKNQLSRFGIKLVTFVTETVLTLKDKVNLEPTQRQFMEDFLKNRKIIIYIDDLDRGWQGKKDDIVRVSALLNSIRDLANESPGLQFKISLRSDVYYLVRTSDESTDKIEGSVVWFSWTNHEILIMLVKRVLTYFGEDANEEVLLKSPQSEIALNLENVFEKRFSGYGKWENAKMHRVLMSLTRKRPRDLVKLCSLAAQKASAEKSNLIRTPHLQSIFEEYSQGRIQDTINEFKSELPSIEKLIFGMKPSQRQRKVSEGYIYSTTELKAKINNIKEQNNFLFVNGRSNSAQDLAQFLYKINFLTARKQLGETIQRKYFEENRYLSNSFVDFGYDWEVHPAFRWALQPDRLDDIFRELDLDSE